MNTSNSPERTKITPRALVRKQVSNKDFHVSEEDMANLDTSAETLYYSFTKSSDHPDSDKKKLPGIPYDHSKQ